MIVVAALAGGSRALSLGASPLSIANMTLSSDSGVFRLAALVNSRPRTRCQRGTIWDASRALARQTNRRIRSTVTRKANPNTSAPFLRTIGTCGSNDGVLLYSCPVTSMCRPILTVFCFARSQGLWQPGDTITALLHPREPRGTSWVLARPVCGAGKGASTTISTVRLSTR
ncbi:hypothetical protein C8Q78DRAFT_410945 [Trametes maxima]|nr:hypothetical protein C8Q78DRAFT_410945 [Trametes maxima]